jgi:hypothetical protein
VKKSMPVILSAAKDLLFFARREFEPPARGLPLATHALPVAPDLIDTSRR